MVFLLCCHDNPDNVMILGFRKLVDTLYCQLTLLSIFHELCIVEGFLV